jgi:putative transposase
VPLLCSLWTLKSVWADLGIYALGWNFARYGAPEIVNANHGSQFTSKAWTDVLDAAGVRISMDGKGRWIDNVFIERPWRSVKYEDVYLRAYENGLDLQAGLTRYFDFYNRRRMDQSQSIKPRTKFTMPPAPASRRPSRPERSP